MLHHICSNLARSSENDARAPVDDSAPEEIYHDAACTTIRQNIDCAEFDLWDTDKFGFLLVDFPTVNDEGDYGIARVRLNCLANNFLRVESADELLVPAIDLLRLLVSDLENLIAGRESDGEICMRLVVRKGDEAKGTLVSSRKKLIYSASGQVSQASYISSMLYTQSFSPLDFLA